MKYGEFLRAYAIPGWSPHYLRYDELKGPLENGLVDERDFVKSIKSEQDRLDLFVSGKVVLGVLVLVLVC